MGRVVGSDASMASIQNATRIGTLVITKDLARGALRVRSLVIARRQ